MSLRINLKHRLKIIPYKYPERKKEENREKYSS